MIFLPAAFDSLQLTGWKIPVSNCFDPVLKGFHLTLRQLRRRVRAVSNLLVDVSRAASGRSADVQINW